MVTPASSVSSVRAFTQQERELFQSCASLYLQGLSDHHREKFFINDDGKTLQAKIGSGRKEDEQATLQFLYNMQESLLGSFITENYVSRTGKPELFNQAKAAADKIGAEYFANIQISGQGPEAEFSAAFSKAFLSGHSRWTGKSVDSNHDGIYEIGDTGGNVDGLNGHLIDAGFATGQRGFETTGYFADGDHASKALSAAIQRAEFISTVSGTKFEQALTIALKEPVSEAVEASKKESLNQLSKEQAVNIARSYMEKASNESAGLTKAEKLALDKDIKTGDEKIKAAMEELHQRLANADTNKDGSVNGFEFIKATDDLPRSPDFRIIAHEVEGNAK